jgi:kynureninase
VNRALVQGADAQDPLRAFRERFALPTRHGTPLVYFCGHSLGLMPLAAREAVTSEVDRWAALGIEAQFRGEPPWVDFVRPLSRGLAALVGAHEHEVVAMNALTVNLHLMLASFYRPEGRRTRVLIESGAFSSDRYAVAAQIAWHGLDEAATLIELAPRTGEDLVRDEDLEAAIERTSDELALVFWPGVQFRTGQAFDCARIARAAHRVGAAAGFDLAHAIGNLSLALHDANADFAVWCGYKYLNGGPGAIGGAYVHERHLGSDERPRLTGWWGNDPASRFDMRPRQQPASGAAAWHVSNPPILACAPLAASLTLFAEAGFTRLRTKSIALTGALQAGIDALPRGAVTLVSPRDPSARGCQLSLRIAGGADRGRRVFAALEAGGAIGDWREPDIIRVAPVPFYNTFAEVEAFVDRLGAALDANP